MCGRERTYHMIFLAEKPFIVRALSCANVKQEICSRKIILGLETSLETFLENPCKRIHENAERFCWTEMFTYLQK